MSSTTKKFKPPWWLKNCHLQSIYANIFPSTITLDLSWEELSLPDGDFIDLAWGAPCDGPLVVLLSGVEGSVSSHYMQESVSFFAKQKMQTVTMHYRSCGGRINRKPCFYDAGDTNQDFKFLVDTLRHRFPDRLIFAVGFSMGGNLLLHYLANQQNSPLSAAAAISVPFELAQSTSYLKQFYQSKILKTLCQKLHLKRQLGVGHDDILIDNIVTIGDFDRLVTAPSFGYSSLEHYYQQCSSRYFLQDIQCPSIILHAWDDPFVPRSSVPNQSELSSSISLELHEHGGHLGFLSGGPPWRPRYWLNQRINAFFSNHY